MGRQVKLAGNVLTVAIAAAIVAGLAVKTQRYGPQFSAGTSGHEPALAAFMILHGWTLVPDKSPGYPFVSATFVRTGCNVPVVVALLGNVADLADDVRLALGPNVRFLERGRRPQGAAVGLARRFADWMSTRDVLAVSPAPPVSESTCSGPSLDDWSAV